MINSNWHPISCRVVGVIVIAAYCSNFRHCVFEPPFGDLGATYDDHLRLVGKHVEHFLLVLIDLFSLGRTAEALQAKIDRKSALSLQYGHFDPKFQIEGYVPHQVFLHWYLGQLMPYNFADFAPRGASWPKISCRRGCPTNHSRPNDLLQGINIWTDFAFILSQSTRLTDGRTDRQKSHS